MVPTGSTAAWCTEHERITVDTDNIEVLTNHFFGKITRGKKNVVVRKGLSGGFKCFNGKLAGSLNDNQFHLRSSLVSYIYLSRDTY